MMSDWVELLMQDVEGINAYLCGELVTQLIPPTNALDPVFSLNLTLNYGHHTQHRYTPISSTSCIKRSTQSDIIYTLIHSIIYRNRTQMTTQKGAVDPIHYSFIRQLWSQFTMCVHIDPLYTLY